MINFQFSISNFSRFARSCAAGQFNFQCYNLQTQEIENCFIVAFIENCSDFVESRRSRGFSTRSENPR